MAWPGAPCGCVFQTPEGAAASARGGTGGTEPVRGTDPPHHVHVTHLGPSKFIGLGFYAASEDDLETLARAPGAGGVEHLDEPGGGKRVTLTDPLPSEKHDLREGDASP